MGFRVDELLGSSERLGATKLEVGYGDSCCRTRSKDFGNRDELPSCLSVKGLSVQCSFWSATSLWRLRFRLRKAGILTSCKQRLGVGFWIYFGYQPYDMRNPQFCALVETEHR